MANVLAKEICISFTRFRDLPKHTSQLLLSPALTTRRRKKWPLQQFRTILLLQLPRQTVPLLFFPILYVRLGVSGERDEKQMHNAAPPQRLLPFSNQLRKLHNRLVFHAMAHRHAHFPCCSPDFPRGNWIRSSRYLSWRSVPFYFLCCREHAKWRSLRSKAKSNRCVLKNAQGVK